MNERDTGFFLSPCVIVRAIASSVPPRPKPSPNGSAGSMELVLGEAVQGRAGNFSLVVKKTSPKVEF